MDINRIKEQANAYEALADNYTSRVMASRRDNSGEQPIGPQELETVAGFFKDVFSRDEDSTYGPVLVFKGDGRGKYIHYERTVNVPRVGSLVFAYQMESESSHALERMFSIDIAEVQRGVGECALKTAVANGGDVPVTELMCLHDLDPYPSAEIQDAVETVIVLRQQLQLPTS